MKTWKSDCRISTKHCFSSYAFSHSTSCEPIAGRMRSIHITSTPLHKTGLHATHRPLPILSTSTPMLYHCLFHYSSAHATSTSSNSNPITSSSSSPPPPPPPPAAAATRSLLTECPLCETPSHTAHSAPCTPREPERSKARQDSCSTGLTYTEQS